MFTFSPTNSRLKQQTDNILASRNEITNLIEVRGEDIPFWQDQYLKLGYRSYGLTGEDLFINYSLTYPESDLKVIETIPWFDKNAMYKKPALCLLTKDFPTKGPLKIAIAAKYAKIARQFLQKYENRVSNILEFNGSVEKACDTGLVDAVIDIVYSGATIQKYGLRIKEVIMLSNIVLIGSCAYD